MFVDKLRDLFRNQANKKYCHWSGKQEDRGERQAALRRIGINIIANPHQGMNQRNGKKQLEGWVERADFEYNQQKSQSIFEHINVTFT